MNHYDNAVQTKELTKKFGDFTAVNSIDFYIEKGEIFGLLGPNGAGKTTTIRMLCGILKQTSGTAKVLGWDIEKDAEEIKKKIGYMSQRFALYNDLSAVENIEFYASVYGVPPEDRDNRIKELIDTAGLAGFEKVQVKNLSGAWRQRLALACAIAHKPPMLFLDEATSGVDPISRREFWDLIYEMAGQGVSVLATTHYMDEAEYCNKIGLILDGKIMAIASPDTLKDNLEGSLAAIECDQLMLAETTLSSHPNVLDTSLHGVVLHVLLTEKNKKDKIIQSLSDAGIHVDNFKFIHPSLEDVFINMVDHKQKHQKD
ncbi:MAG: ABC transporter ATP-binding protein [Anaerolineaceae bacterium]|nr:ABC transporter ATP-binding protein [Anaerolineaceae bacterium]